MKAKGHNICDTLMAIRKQIADANGIDYSPEECHFTGECKGTCPKCEQDVRYLEHELRLRLKAGKAIKVAGVALGIIALAASITSCSTQKGYYNSTPLLSKKVIPIRFQEYTSKDSILLKDKESFRKKGVLFVQGHIIDENTKEPIVGAFITAKLSGKKTAADIDGNFTIEVEPKDTITIKFIGMQDRIIKLSEMNFEKLNVITLTESGGLMGEIVVIKKGHKHKKKKTMARGRYICNTLKAIRKQIADANGIDYSPEECHFTGECKGTCPKCEQDVRDLEHELRRRQTAGKAIKVAGIAAGLVVMAACSDGKPQGNDKDTLTRLSTTLHEDSIDPTMYNGESDRTKPIKNVTVKKFMPLKEDSKPSKKNKRAKTAVVQSAIATDSTNNSKIFDNVDEEASFSGGIAACMKYIADNFRYSNIQGDCSIQGKIVVSFIVNEDGNLNDIKVKKSVYSDLDQEAVRVVKSMPKWIPAKQNGKAVKSKYTLPVYIHVQ